MTREIGDILIQQTVESDYEIERKVRIIERIEKLVLASLNIAATIAERKANQVSKIEEAKEMLQNDSSVIIEKQTSKQEQIEEAKQRLEAGETVREVSQDIPERIVREVSRNIRTQECTQDVREAPTRNVRETVREVVREEPIPDPEREQNEDKPVLEVATYNTEDEKAVAMKRLAGLTGLKRAAMAAAIERYFKDRQTFNDAYKDDPGMKFAYTLDDYINGARFNIESK